MSKYFTWDIEREIFHIYGPLSLRWYSLLFIAGILVGNLIFVGMVKREGKPVQLCESLLYYVVIGLVVGARLGHCLFYDPLHYLSRPWEILQVWEGGLASHGGYLGLIIACYLFSRKHKEMSFLWIMDRMAMMGIFAGAFIRLGNFFNSEIVGRVTNVPWAIVFARVDGYPRHPAQLYESLGYLTISMGLYLLHRTTKIGNLPGRLLGLACVLAFSFRTFIEMFKENQAAFESSLPFNMGQLLSIPFIFVGILLILGVHSRSSLTKSFHS
ncbi:MAG: prolipoprotein diacylglyceryl transferase [Deltaproteobacteria bacterium]|nr:prolipoprotein diacylglyceryl transferase [Deltaproteobacteria bacterium]